MTDRPVSGGSEKATFGAAYAPTLEHKNPWLFAALASVVASAAVCTIATLLLALR